MRTCLSPVQGVRLRRQLYAVLIMGGLVALLTAMLTDARSTVSGGELAVAAPAPRNMRQLTDGAGIDGFGAISPDGKQIAFMRDGRIMVMPAGGGEQPVALTSNAAVWDSVPAWRPGGQEVAFVRMSMHGDVSRIMVVRVTGGGGVPGARVMELTSVPEPVGHLAWDPTGRTLYFTTARELRKLTVGTKQGKVVASLPEDWEMTAGGLAISPDGRYAVFGAGPRVGRRVRYDLWMVPLEGGRAKPARLTTGGGIMPGFGPSGRRIAFRNPRAGTGIYVMEVRNRSARRVVSDEPGAMYFHPAFTPDGRSLLLSRLMLNDRAKGQGGRFTSHLYLHRLAQTGGDGI